MMRVGLARVRLNDDRMGTSMTEQATQAPQPAPQTGVQDRRPPQGGRTAPRWAHGVILFAGMLMVLAGAFEAIAGLVGIFTNEFYVTTRQYLLQFDVTRWGWINLLVGAVVVATGFALLAGQAWGRVAGMVLVGLSALANFAFLPYYPFWSLTVIALDVFVLWALAVHGRDVSL
jgi:hypothetical protein